ncbi:MAG: CoA pyrophosphatase [Deltaproteobacteria bacterium]|nr:CoA pyrophosphatase [Deltaproteobacteria bacterium]
MIPDIHKIQDIFGRHPAKTADLLPDLMPAAVLVPIYPDPEGLSLIFTKRTNHLDHHKGQISFPGGRRDPEDHDAKDTALRETYEEIGVRPEHVEILGRMNQDVTVTGFSLAPVVGLIPYPYQFKLHSYEVERLIIAPLSHLMDPANSGEDTYPWQGKQYKTYNYFYKNDVIWGATARIVHKLIILLTTGREPELEA